MVKERYGLYLDKDLVKQAKMLCVQSEVSLSEFVEMLLKEKLKKKD